MSRWEEDANGRRWEISKMGPEAVGLLELEYHALRMLEEGNGVDSLAPDVWEVARPVLIERGLLRQQHLGFGEGGTVHVVTEKGLDLLHRVGTFRRMVPERQLFRLFGVRVMVARFEHSWLEVLIVSVLAGLAAAVAWEAFK